MALTSWVFALFFICVIIVYWLCPRKFRDIILIVASLIFYGYAALKQLPVILVLMLLTYRLGYIIEKAKYCDALKKAKVFTVFGVTLLIIALTYYKYSLLLVKTWNGLAAKSHFLVLPNPGIVTPLAISFITFQFIHYLVDKYKGKIQGNSFRQFMAYTMFFPTLLAGPIKRYETFASQINSSTFEFSALSFGLGRVIIGLAKKIVLADTFAVWGDKLLSPQSSSGLMLIAAVYCYSMKIYFDFSGYSDMALGTAKMLGFNIPENFNWPYLADNISTFWRRWHISLSDWIKDYLFIPLGGSRVPYFRHFINAVITMALCGLWHGASWTFLVWGLWHGIGQGIYGLYKRSGILSSLKDNRLWRLAGWFVTFNFVSFGWIFFAAASIQDALLIFSRILTIR